MKTFEELGVGENIRHAIEDLGFEQPMPVQEQVIPYLLENPNDVIALAQTGTGKTAAYGLPLMQKLDPNVEGTQAIVLSPTRELCNQIADDLNGFAKYLDHVHVTAVYGGASIMTQIHELRHNVPIVAATPGRMIDLMNRGALKLDHVKTIILDEADEMLNMGFSDSINAIFEKLPEGHTTWMFSATMTKDVEKVAKKYLHDYKEIVVGSRNEGAENVNHVYYMVNARDKYLALKRIVDFHPHIYAIIFCRTKRETQEIADKLIHDGYNAEALHGDLSQDQRDATMQKFRQHTTQLLVATDVAARGLDVEDLTHVINFGLPDDIESYTHRSGRTGRAGKKGTSISIIHSREKGKVRQIEKEIGKKFVDGTLPAPEEICQKQLYKTMDDIMKTDVDEDLIAPYMDEIDRQFEYVDKEDIIKKMVTITFGRFLNYYKNAPAIEKPSSSRRSSDNWKSEGGGYGKSSRGRRERGGSHEAEAGYTRLFINIGKADGFYPGEVMQYVNKHVHDHQEIGHIDLLSKFSYIEVPQGDAQKVMSALDGTTYKGRDVRCNAADQPGHGNSSRGGGARHDRGDRKRGDYSKSRQSRRPSSTGRHEETHDNSGKKEDWRTLVNQAENVKFKDPVPDFSEEGWARRKPKEE